RRGLGRLAGPALLALATAVFCWKLLVGSLVVIGYDTMTYMYPYRFFAAAALGEGRLPLWNPYIYYGVPFLANLQSAVFYPLHVLFLVLRPTEAMNWSVVLHLFLAAYFAYLLACRLVGLDAVSATVAGALYGLGGFVGSQVGHLNQLNAAAWLPAALLVLHLALIERRPRWVALLAVVLAVQLLAGHAQESYMTLVLLAGYASFHVAHRVAHRAFREARAGIGRWREWRERDLGAQGSRRLGVFASRAGRGTAAVLGEAFWAAWVLGIAGALAGGLAAVQLLPTNELAGLSIRAGGMPIAEASSFSLPPRQLFIGLLPTFGLAAPTSNEYLGWVGFGGLALALLGLLFRARRPATLFFAIVGMASFLLALGNHFPLYERAFHLPGMDLFRVPARWLLLTSLAVAMLGGSGLAFLRQLGGHGWPAGVDTAPAVRPWQRLAAATRLLLGVVVVAGAAAVLWPFQRAGADGFPPALIGLWLVLGSGVVALMFWGLAAAPSVWPAVAFIVWVFAELFCASRPLEYNNPNPEAVYTASRPVIDALRQIQGPDRRLLSIAATGYHPSDAEQLVGPYRDRLGENGVLATLINTKYKEIISPNLSMVFGLPTVDGYDGGVLPLRRYVEYKRLLVPPEQNVPDALLRDQLKQIPPPSRLRLLGATDIIADTIGDVVHEGVFYDLGSPITIGPGATARYTRFAALSPADRPDAVGPVTAVGVVTSLEGAGAVPNGAPVAALTLGGPGGPVWRADLVAGRDTAEGVYAATMRHQQPAPLVGGDSSGGSGSASSMYLARLSVENVASVTWVAVQSHLPDAAGRLRLHGVTLIGAGGQSWPVALAGDTLRLVHRSDVKLYTDEAPLPRAYAVATARAVDGPEAALQALSEAGHDPRQVAVLERDPGPPPPASTAWRARLRRLRDGLLAWLGVAHDPRLGTVAAGLTLPVGRSTGATGVLPSSSVSWVEDSPERVVLHVELNQPGLVVLRDSYFPGWTVQVDGRPARLLRADVLFRAVPVPAGAHTVEFRYRSVPLERGALFSAVALGLTLALAALPRVRFWARPGPEVAPEPTAAW
ncbi:MAG: hypothetical protein ACRDI2_06845, partial [Chloroflexota bacterium]